MKNTQKNKGVIIYQAKNGAIELRGDFSHETIWATQAQIVDLFGVDQSVVSRHIHNIFKDGEIDEKSNMQKMHNANSDKPLTLYSFDVILGVGYRINSRVAIEFRRWATKTLRNYIVDGFAINKSRVAKNYAQFLRMVDDVKELLPSCSSINPKDVVELITLFADTWISLDAYDKERSPKGKLTKKKVDITVTNVSEGLKELRRTLIGKDEATEIFGHERSAGSVAGIVGNVMQSFGGNELYPTVEEKAAHLLYFMVKNHPYTDGNKRSGAFAFVWFLKQANILDTSKLTPSALTALTVLVAESDPSHKDRIIGLILLLLKK
ncbi:MAG: virulence protein RhuM/Fic/DOC family protein [Candidatus Vogelbacteria bacterium]|nr:virulence protein RhuM/Fic/DOC family protein [Candidatus Vogelbacteria bacterium]